jgi:hypothetical protein
MTTLPPEVRTAFVPENPTEIRSTAGAIPRPHRPRFKNPGSPVTGQPPESRTVALSPHPFWRFDYVRAKPEELAGASVNGTNDRQRSM